MALLLGQKIGFAGAVYGQKMAFLGHKMAIFAKSNNMLTPPPSLNTMCICWQGESFQFVGCTNLTAHLKSYIIPMALHPHITSHLPTSGGERVPGDFEVHLVSRTRDLRARDVRPTKCLERDVRRAYNEEQNHQLWAWVSSKLQILSGTTACNFQCADHNLLSDELRRLPVGRSHLPVPSRQL